MAAQQLPNDAYRPATLPEALAVLKYRLSEHLSPAEKRELEQAIAALSTSAPCNMDVIVSHERHEHLLKCESLLSETGRGDTAKDEPFAYEFNGNLYWRDGLAAEQRERATPLYLRSNGGSAKVPEGCQRTVHGYCPRGCMGQCAAEVKAMRKT